MKVELKRIILRGTCQCCVVAAWSVLVQDSPLSLPYFSVLKNSEIDFPWNCCLDASGLSKIVCEPWFIRFYYLSLVLKESPSCASESPFKVFKGHQKFTAPLSLEHLWRGAGRRRAGSRKLTKFAHFDNPPGESHKTLSTPWPLSMWNESTPRRTSVLRNLDLNSCVRWITRSVLR